MAEFRFQTTNLLSNRGSDIIEALAVDDGISRLGYNGAVLPAYHWGLPMRSANLCPAFLPYKF